ncbi:hypothetical protein GCM10008944_01720 [Cytobacillus oceanisediminis]
MATKLAPFPGQKAVDRARTYVGRAAYSGMCQAFTVTMFGTGAVGDYDGDRDADAVDGWRKAVARGRVVKASAIGDFTKIPAGVALYWSGGSRDYGHAAVSIGGGRMVTTDASRGLVGIANIKGWWARSHTFLGYVEVEGNGHTLRADVPAAPITALWGQASTWKLGAVGADVTRLGERIVVHAKALGLPAPYKSGPGPTFTEVDRAALQAVQKAWGWTGDNADGYPGPHTFKRLAATPVAPAPKPVAAPFSVMSWNLKSPTLTAPISWLTRRARQVAEIKRQAPSVFLVQEAGSPSHVKWYDAALKPVGLYNARATDAEGSGKWRAIYYQIDDWVRVASGLYNLPASTLYKGDQKPMVWTVLKHRATGERWLFSSAHLENDAPADNERVAQMLAVLAKLEAVAEQYDVADDHIVCGVDTNSRSWVRDRVHIRTAFRDAFSRAKKTAGKDTASHNAWKDAREGERIDVIFTTADDVLSASQTPTPKAADHNPQTALIAA